MQLQRFPNVRALQALPSEISALAVNNRVYVLENSSQGVEASQLARVQPAGAEGGDDGVQQPGERGLAGQAEPLGLQPGVQAPEAHRAPAVPGSALEQRLAQDDRQQPGGELHHRLQLK